MSKDTLQISEEFESIQGEGKFAGVPSYFVRTSGCNLRCWWCDTPYTSWKPDGQCVNVEHIVNRIRYSACPHVVITGGEPMLWPEQVCQLVGLCQEIGKVVTIETNGTRPPLQQSPNLYSVSPKLPSSCPTSATADAEAKLHLKNIAAVPLHQFIPQLYDSFITQFKFVVTDKQDEQAVLHMVAHHRLPKESVWLMPEGRTAKEVLAKHQTVIAMCMEHGFNFSTRLQTLTWGAKRGV